MSFGEVYLITNRVNGRQYVGQTTGSSEYRWTQHVSAARYSPYTVIDCAIKKYGSENFTLEVIDVAETREHLNKLEAEWMDCLETLVPGGYNVARSGWSPSMETRRKMGEWQRGRILPQSQRDRLSASLIGNQRAKGNKFTDEQRAKVSRGITGNSFARKLTDAQVAEILRDTRFQSAIAKDYGVSQGTISLIKRRSLIYAMD